MRSSPSRRRFLQGMAAGLSAAALPRLAQAQSATQPPATPRPAARPSPYRVNEPVSIDVNARPLPSFDIRDRARTRFGALEYRSGLILTSSFSGFGGLSALRLDAKGERFIAVSDQGSWFTGRIVYRGREMVGLDDVEAAPLLGADGRPITATRGWYDSESLALDGSFAYVGLERVNQVLRFDFAKGFTRSRGEVIALPPAARKLPNNKGLEGLVFVPKATGQPLAGTLIAFSERGLDASGNLIAFLVGGKTPGQFSVRRSENFDISDAVLLPSGGLLILERKFSWFGGVGIRIRRLALSDIAPGAVVDGPAIFNADLGNEIDNMEGIDAHVTEEGETVLTMVSDDNFSLIQRNLLLQFTLVD
ncbi:esterase-like activity of phytase family protein [Bradyrhizobium australafricanum]|uniref:esterase-like activity of phytase family protein n=1 Tax=Bradyrhizobium australafricanum TaxID=2821406 RepID=UPI001CE33D32|nr:esterase-like activity of phytase family protein [Bradyrhizobium australafricanum]MCA6101974.1 esterase-like activity of phytase family protein [Bradyrhizobium australafricanum]